MPRGKPHGVKSDAEAKPQRMPKKTLASPVYGKTGTRTGKVAKEQLPKSK